MPDGKILDIIRLGAQGDGIAETAAGPVYVPFALAGERITATVEGERGRLLSVERASAERAKPICRHFGTCGGCAVQHMAPPLYAAWKRETVVAAFASRGLSPMIANLVMPQGKRRRVTFTARRTASGTLMGFHEAGTHELVDLAECPVTEPAMVAALPQLRALVTPLISRKGEARLIITLTNGGLDVAIADIERDLSSGVRAGLAASASTTAIARVSVAGDPVFETFPPVLTFGTVDVVIPPGAFIQAVGAAEEAMSGIMMGALGKVKSVADLFSGVGALAFRLAQKAKVFAADSDREAITALNAAVKTARGIKPVTAIRRDLFREPLSALELKDFDAVVFDPPRAGAETQAQMIGKSKVKTVVAVSCNPATLARDARILIDGGYALESVMPIDQFHYSPHVECVAVFRR